MTCNSSIQFIMIITKSLMSKEDYEARKAAKIEAELQSIAAREREERRQASQKKKKHAGPNFAEMDDDDDRDVELPPLAPAWTDNSNEIPLARAHTAVRSAREVKIEKARFSIADADQI